MTELFNQISKGIREKGTLVMAFAAGNLDRVARQLGVSVDVVKSFANGGNSVSASGIKALMQRFVTDLNKLAM